MRKIHIILVASLLSLSCDNFLEYKDNDKVIPSNLQHFEELIYGELIKKSCENVFYNLDMMSDETGCEVLKGNSSSDDPRRDYVMWYQWSKQPQINYQGEEDIEKAWEIFYHKIVICNTIENELNMLSDDLKGIKQRLLGEVQTIRAISYFYLVNMFGAPYYNQEQANTAMGVPINREIGIYDKTYIRSTLQEIYDEIEKDLKSGLDNFAKGEKKNSIFRPNSDVARLFLAKSYLFQHKYNDAITVCSKLIETSHAIIEPIDELKSINHSDLFLFRKNSKSMIFTWCERFTYPFLTYGTRYVASQKLIQLYRNNDIRLSKYFNGMTPSKINRYTSDCYSLCYRIEEAYLLRAEANIALNNISEAILDINSIRKERFTDGNHQCIASTQEEALNQLKEEKMRELAFETTRWFDLRRWNEGVVHEYPNFNDPDIVEYYILKAGSPNYILPLPLDLERRNTNIERANRIEIAPSNIN